MRFAGFVEETKTQQHGKNNESGYEKEVDGCTDYRAQNHSSVGPRQYHGYQSIHDGHAGYKLNDPIPYWGQ